jgi:hypothetical protein
MRVLRMSAAIVAAVGLFSTSAGATIVSDWNAAALVEVRVSKFGPPIVARALAIAHTCMYDAWAAYDRVAIGTAPGWSLRRPTREQTESNKAEAISFAAYNCLVNLFPTGADRLAQVMKDHGYDPTNTSTDITTPAGIGNVAAQRVIDDRRQDGSNQYGDLHPVVYSDYTGYTPRNPPMAFCTPLMASCPPVDVADPLHWQPLISDAGVMQTFITPHWENVRPFALSSGSQFDGDPRIVPPPDVQAGPNHYLKNVQDMLNFSRDLDDNRKLIVEYWADGPASELPAGHWGLFAQFISARDQNSIDEDVKMFFAMHNASFDAGIFAWHVKRQYDGVRPITAIRDLMEGQPVLAWGGPGRPTEVIDGAKWMPYNPGSNLTPAFPGYPSGHSTYSAASAEVLRAFTGSDYFGFSTVIPANFGRVEPGIPAVPTTLSFRTFTDAAKQAGLSRLYGGIHFSDDNTTGQRAGRIIGRLVWIRAWLYFHGIQP